MEEKYIHTCACTHTYTHLCTHAYMKVDRELQTQMDIFIIKYIFCYFDKQEKLFRVREIICGWNPTNVLVAIWDIESLSLCHCPTGIRYKCNYSCPLLGQKWMLGFLMNITKINLATNPNLAAPRHRSLFNQHRARFNQLSADPSFLNGLLWITHQRPDWDQWYFLLFSVPYALTWWQVGLSDTPCRHNLL